MAKRGDPGVLRYVVNFLRFHSGLTQQEFGRACRVDQAEISRYELGKLAPSEEILLRMAEVAKIEWPLVIHTQQFYTSLLSSIGRGGVSVRTPDLKSFEPVLLAVSPYWVAPAAEPARPSPEEERREADQTWTVLERHPIPLRSLLIGASPSSGSWALAERVCEASARSSAGEALELAELAVSIAERIPRESWRSRLLGYCWAHVANARRAGNDFAGADKALSRARELWQAGAGSGPELLDEERLFALEDSLLSREE